MIADLGAVVDLLVTDVANVRRPAPDAYDADGRAQPRTFTALSARLCVQPLSGTELQRLDAGSYARDLVSVWSRTPLQVGDIVTIDGEYEVESVETWIALGNYCRATARKRGPSEARP